MKSLFKWTTLTASKQVEAEWVEFRGDHVVFYVHQIVPDKARAISRIVLAVRASTVNNLTQEVLDAPAPPDVAVFYSDVPQE